MEVRKEDITPSMEGFQLLSLSRDNFPNYRVLNVEDKIDYMLDQLVEYRREQHIVGTVREAARYISEEDDYRAASLALQLEVWQLLILVSLSRLTTTLHLQPPAGGRPPKWEGPSPMDSLGCQLVYQPLTKQPQVYRRAVGNDHRSSKDWKVYALTSR